MQGMQRRSSFRRKRTGHRTARQDFHYPGRRRQVMVRRPQAGKTGPYFRGIVPEPGKSCGDIARHPLSFDKGENFPGKMGIREKSQESFQVDRAGNRFGIVSAGRKT
jgi:hypothetical protein